METTQQRPALKASPVVRSYPKKLFYRINEVAEITGLKPYVLRYWETQFKELSPGKDKNEQRRYRQDDIEMVLQIKDLLYDKKYTIAGARQFFRSQRGSKAPVPTEPTPATELRKIRAELMDLVKRLSA